MASCFHTLQELSPRAFSKWIYKCTSVRRRQPGGLVVPVGYIWGIFTLISHHNARRVNAICFWGRTKQSKWHYGVWKPYNAFFLLLLENFRGIKSSPTFYQSTFKILGTDWTSFISHVTFLDLHLSNISASGLPWFRYMKPSRKLTC